MSLVLKCRAASDPAQGRKAIPGQNPLDRSWPNFGLDYLDRDLDLELDPLVGLLHACFTGSCALFPHNCERFKQRLANDAGSRALGEIVTKACKCS
jgi:hypothetical protein